MALGSIVIDLLLKTGAFTTDAKTAERRLQDLSKTAKAAGAALGAAIAAGATIAAVALKQTIDRMDDMSKAAKTVGMDTEGFSRLAYAADLANVSQEELQSGLGRLVKAQAAAMKEGSQQAEMFKALGIAITDASGAMRPTRDVMLDFADQFAAMKGQPEALAAGLDIFGRGFQTFVPLIEGGSQAIRALEAESDALGATLDGKAGDAAEVFNDNLARLGFIAQGFAQEVAAGMLPALEDASERLVEMAADGDLAGNAITLLSAAVGAGVGILESYNTAVAVTSAAIETMANASTGFAQIQRNIGIGGLFDEGSIAAGIAQVKAAFAEGDRVLAGINNPKSNPFANVRSASSTSRSPAGPNIDALRRALGGGEKAAKGAKPQQTEAEKEIERLDKAYQSLNESMAEQIALFGQTSEVAKVRYEIESGGLKGITEARAQALIEQAEWMDAMADQAALEEVYADARQDQTDRMIASWDAATDEMTVFAEQAGRNMQDAFAAFLFDPFEDGLGGMLRGFSDMLRKMAAEMAASEAMKALGNYGEANGGTWWGQMLGSFFGGGKAAGGPVSGSKLYEVGEGGNPELFKSGNKTFLIPGNNGTVVPATAGGGGASGGVTVNIHNAPAGAEVQSRRNGNGGMDIDVIFKQIEGRMAQSMSGDGMLGRATQGTFGLQRRGVTNG